jgi:putative transposase
MSRLRRIVDRDRIFFVTTNLARAVPILSPSERDLVLEQLKRQHTQGDFLLFGYVVMPGHLHLLLMPQRRGLTGSMHALKRVTAEKLLRRRGCGGPLWQARYFDFVLRRVRDFWKKLEYIHDNPVAAGLATRADQSRWSSAVHYVRSGAAQVSVDAVDFTGGRRGISLASSVAIRKASGLGTHKSRPRPELQRREIMGHFGRSAIKAAAASALAWLRSGAT